MSTPLYHALPLRRLAATLVIAPVGMITSFPLARAIVTEMARACSNQPFSSMTAALSVLGCTLSGSATAHSLALFLLLGATLTLFLLCLWHLLSAFLLILVCTGRTATRQRASALLDRFGSPLLRAAVATALSTSIASTPALAAPQPQLPGIDQHGPVAASPALIVDSEAAPSPILGARTNATVSAISTAATTVTVKPGDSLWSISAELVQSDDPFLIAKTWKAIYALNRSVIGADPNLIHPQMQLQIPAEVNS